MFIIRTKLIAVQRTRMRKLGFDWQLFDEETKQSKTPLAIPGLMEGDQSQPYLFSGSEMKTKPFNGLIDALGKQKLVKILADPTVVMTEGQESRMAVGGTVRTEGEEPKDVFFGTRQTASAKLIDSDQVRIRMDFECSELAGKDESGNPIVIRNQFQSELDIELGKTFVIAKALKQVDGSGKAEETVLLLAVTPELVK